MTVDVTKCHRHLRITFFLLLWMFSYVQMTDQLRLDLSEIRCNATNH